MSWDPYSEFQSKTLDNGLTIYALQVDRPWQRIGFMFRNGSTQDPIGKEGTAHFVEHLISQNAPLPCKDLEDFFHNTGGSAMLGATNFWYTKYQFYIPKDDNVIKLSLNYFAEMLMNEKLVNNIERERNVIINEYKKKYPVAFRYDLDAHQHAVLFKNLLVGRCIDALGTPESIEKITDIDLQEYYDNYYIPENLSVIAVGGYSLEELVELLSATAFNNKKNGIKITLTPVECFPPLPENRHVFNVSDFINATSITKSGAYATITRIPLSVKEGAVGIFCAMLSELLTDEIRESKGWTYSIKCRYSHYIQYYKPYIECNSLDIDAIDVIESYIEKIITSLTSHEGLFNKIKQNAIASAYMSDSNGLDILNEAREDVLKYGSIITLSLFKKQFEEVKFSDVCNILHYWKPENRWTLISRP